MRVYHVLILATDALRREKWKKMTTDCLRVSELRKTASDNNLRDWLLDGDNSMSRIKGRKMKPDKRIRIGTDRHK